MDIEKKREYNRQRYYKNREKLKKQTLSYYYVHREQINRKKREDRPERIQSHNPLPKPLAYAKNKILSHYGNTCACCGEGTTKLLTIEHMNNDGYKTRKLGLKGAYLYSYLIKENYPEGIAILCFNCNIGKRNNRGLCPHKE